MHKRADYLGDRNQGLETRGPLAPSSYHLFSRRKEADMKSSKLLVAVIVLQSLILVSQWTGQSPVTPAYGQIPDAGGQRQQIIDELRTLNGKMDRMHETLKSGDVQVRVP